MSSVGGIQSLIALCESRRQQFDLLPLQSSDPSEHHFGPDSKGVSVQKIIGKSKSCILHKPKFIYLCYVLCYAGS